MTTITRIHAREVLDSRGRPTVEVDVWVGDRAHGRAIVPSGASTGRAEALELRDGNPERYGGRGVRKAVDNVNEVVAPQLVDCDASDQTDIDRRLLALDGTPQKTKLGANALLGVSLAAACAMAKLLQTPLYQYLARWSQLAPADPDSATKPPVRPKLPRPMVNMISGGLHAGRNLDIQDFMAIPRGAKNFRQALEWMVRLYERVGEVLRDAGYEGYLVGDEGGYGPQVASNREAAELLVRAIESAGLRPGEDVAIALDVAASHFFDATYYQLRCGGEVKLGPSEMVDWVESLARDFPITSIEDPLAEDDWDAWQALTSRLGDRVHIVGDDLLATNLARLKTAIEKRAANAILIKPNQVGTLTETLQAMQHARDAGWTCIASARSGETEDTFIADLAVGAAADYIKIGSVVRGERTAKYNQLLRIAEELGQ